MPLFVLTCTDKPGALEARMGARAAHLAYVRDSGVLKLGGPLLDDQGEMAGSLLIIDVPDRAAAEGFSDNDPYLLAGVFERVEIRPFKATFGTL